MCEQIDMCLVVYVLVETRLRRLQFTDETFDGEIVWKRTHGDNINMRIGTRTHERQACIHTSAYIKAHLAHHTSATVPHACMLMHSLTHKHLKDIMLLYGFDECFDIILREFEFTESLPVDIH